MKGLYSDWRERGNATETWGMNKYCVELSLNFRNLKTRKINQKGHGEVTKVI